MMPLWKTRSQKSSATEPLCSMSKNLAYKRIFALRPMSSRLLCSVLTVKTAYS